jgi:3-methyladenine DNA glycosylase AlkD
MNTYQLIVKDLEALADREKALSMQRFFKTGKGEYGEGDLFYGVSVPQQRLIAKKYVITSEEFEVISLLDSPVHEQRLTGVFILVHKFNAAIKKNSEERWVKIYLSKTKSINNWDLVDSSAHLILGKWLENKERSILYDLADSSLLWDNRIAVVATLHFIRKHDFEDIFKLSKRLLNHKHDLIHKATGWMLREVWGKSPDDVEHFLDAYSSKMPRTMLRYTIEKMSKPKRLYYMKK